MKRPMKRLLLSAVASLVLAGGFSAPALAQAWSQQDGAHHEDGQRGDRGGQARGQSGGGQPHAQANAGQPNAGQANAGQGRQDHARSFNHGTQLNGGQVNGGQPGGGPPADRLSGRNFRQNQGAPRDDHRYADRRDGGQRFDGRNDHRNDFARRDVRPDRRYGGGWAGGSNYRHWSRGEFLGDYLQRYARIDYRAWRLTPPPYGYCYVEDDYGDILLVALATGLIADIIIEG